MNNMKKNNNQGPRSPKSKKDAIMSVRQSPGDSGVISGIVATGVAVVVGYDETQDDWRKTVKVNIPTSCGNGFYTITVPTGRYQNRLMNMDDASASFMSEIGLRAGTNRAYFEGKKEPSFFDSDFAGNTLPSGKSGGKNRRVPIQRSGKHQGRAVPCYQPKNYNLRFFVDVLCNKMLIVPPWVEDRGVRLVGETTAWLEKYEGVNRVKYTIVAKEEEE